MAQDATATQYNRYPGTFRTVKLHAERSFGGRPLRILSFGCSHGLELVTLKAYFPDAAIFGCDVNEAALSDAAALNDGICVFRSTPDAIKAYGPYDIIFAMSVLCRFSKSKKARTIENIFSFQEFEAHIGLLDSVLADDGLFCIYNSNYLFSQSSLSKRYAPVRSPLIESNGFVDKWTAEGIRITSVLKGKHGREHVLENLPDLLSDEDFRDVVFQKGLPHAVSIDVQKAPTGMIKFKKESGADLQAAIEGHRIASRFVSRILISGAGDIWVGRSWCKSTIDRKIVELPVWWTRGHSEMAGSLSNDQLRWAIQAKRKKPGIGAYIPFFKRNADNDSRH